MRYKKKKDLNPKNTIKFIRKKLRKIGLNNNVIMTSVKKMHRKELKIISKRKSLKQKKTSKIQYNATEVEKDEEI